MSQFDANQNTLLTGGAGFIGSWVAEHWAQNNEATLVVVDKLSYCASLRNLERIKDNPNVHFVKGDVGNFDLMSELISNFEIATILHFAGESSVDASFEHGPDFTMANTLGTQTLLEVAKKHSDSIKRFIYFSTDEVYGEVAPDALPATETAPLMPTNPYSASKAAADLIAQSYVRCFGLPLIIARCCNVYGPRQYPEKLVSRLAASLEGRQEFTLHGDGSHRRCYVHVSDVVSAVGVILRSGEVGQIYNISTSDEMSNLEMTKTVCGLVAKPSAVIKFGQDRPYNDCRYSISNTLLTELGWDPEMDLETGLRETLEWYSAFGPEWWL